MTDRTKSLQAADDVAALLRARNPLIWIVTREEARVERYLFEAGAAAGYVTRTWDCVQGVVDAKGEAQSAIGSQDCGDTFRAISDRARGNSRGYGAAKGDRGVWVMRDLPVWLQGLPGASPMRALRNLCRMLPGVARDNSQAVVVLSPSRDVPPELAGHATVVDWPLPDRAEIAQMLDAAIEALPEYETDRVTGEPDLNKPLRSVACQNGTRDAAIDAAVGLSGEEAQATFSRSLITTKRIDPVLVAAEKKRVIAREGGLEWFDPLPGGLEAVGGLENLKAWLLARSSAFTPKARAFGLPAPKGTLLVGISGCGKSLTAKAVATAWNMPLLRLDLGALKSKFVGGSETNLRKAFETIAAVGRCIVWLDEIEKALQGSTTDSSDGGVLADALGAILSWMQDRQGEAFVIATANDISKLPPELLRKGRFDEIFFVDLPNHTERCQIVKAALKAFGRKFDDPMDYLAVADATETFTGSEVAALVPDAMFVAFEDGEREVTAADLVAAAALITPLAKTSDKIEKLQQWASEGRARLATKKAENKSSATDGRRLDF